MKDFSITDLAKILKAHEPRVTSDKQRFFTGISIDSRTIKAGKCFFAIEGEHFDGHDYIAQALAKGAVCAVVNKNKDLGNLSSKCLLKVDDTTKALGIFAAEYRMQNDFKVVGITGSVGKTTARQIVYHILNKHFRVFTAPKNFNNEIGLPLTLLGADSEDEIILAELGSNHTGEIAYLSQIARPDIAVVTNVCLCHLEGFGNLQIIIDEKLSISEGLQNGGNLIINGDDKQLVDACGNKDLNYITFGKSDGCDIQAQDIFYGPASSKFTIDGEEIILPFAGEGNVENALAAAAICGRLGICPEDFADGLRDLAAVPMRTELLEIEALTVLNDCYNANPTSMRNALGILKRLGSAKNNRLVFVCGDMGELGERSEQLHAELGIEIAEAKVQLLLAVGKFAQTVAGAVKENVNYDLKIKCFEDSLSVCNNLEKFIKDDDVILVKGSRSVKLETVVERLKEIFSHIEDLI